MGWANRGWAGRVSSVARRLPRMAACTKPFQPDSAAPARRPLRMTPPARAAAWCKASPLYRHYHDHEWGFPVADDRRLFEKSAWRDFSQA